MTLKVLHCIHSLSGGGAERQLTTLANHVKGVDMAFGIFCIDSSNNELEDGACELFELSDPTNYPWYMIKEASAVIKQFRPDIVHCWLPPSVIVPSMIAANLHGVPVVSSYRCTKAFDTWKEVLEYFADTFFANAIVSNNSVEKSNAFFRSLYNHKIHEHIPNAVAVPTQFRKRKMERDANEIYTIVFVGRLIDIKNWQVLLKALASLSDAKPWQLLICGTGETEKVVNFVEQLGLNARVKMLGYSKDVYAVMAESDVLVLPSWCEGMPNVVLEAMSIGLPCVISKIPAHTELLGDESVGIFFDPSSSEELARILGDLINGNADVNKMSQRCIEFTKKFSPGILVDRYLRFYNKVRDEFRK